MEVLRWHGVRVERVDSPRRVRVEVFRPREVRESPRLFQKHRERTLVGSYVTGERELPKGTLLVPARQPLGRLAAQLLEAVSEDSLATWNFFDEDLFPDRDGNYPDYPVLRVLAQIR